MSPARGGEGGAARLRAAIEALANEWEDDQLSGGLGRLRDYHATEYGDVYANDLRSVLDAVSPDADSGALTGAVTACGRSWDHRDAGNVSCQRRAGHDGPCAALGPKVPNQPTLAEFVVELADPREDRP